MDQQELFKRFDMGSTETQGVHPPAVLVDMDGTLCHREGFTDRDPMTGLGLVKMGWILL